MYQPVNLIQQLTDYIRKNLIKGYTLDSLRVSLINQGYSKISVEKAIERANQQIAQEIPPIKEKPQITHKIITEDNEVIIPEKKGFLKRIFG